MDCAVGIRGKGFVMILSDCSAARSIIACLFCYVLHSFFVILGWFLWL